ncbi:MAG: hypothetical protein R2828_23110 [Saprospiraceae bacterium]
MTNISDRDYLECCKRLIKEKFSLGNEQGEIRRRDLAFLIEEIAEQAGVKISLSTLKRIWKSDFSQTPQVATLNALVTILGYEDWHAFKSKYQLLSLEEPKSVHWRFSFPTWALLPIALLAVIPLLMFSSNQHEPTSGVAVNGEVLFSANKTLDIGTPNTVIFNYDISGVKADSFFIQQTWNPQNKIPIQPEFNYKSCIYYTPGFHHAKLVANETVIKELLVNIVTDGWFPLVKYQLTDPIPIYVTNEAIKKGTALKMERADLLNAGVDIGKDFLLRYYNIQDFNDTPSNQFDFETRFRCDSLLQPVCPSMRILIICESGVYYMPLIRQGCEANLEFYIGGEYRSGGSHDLSALGTDVYQWQDLRLNISQGMVSVYLNGRQLYNFPNQVDVGKIKGLIYTFNTLGEVASVRLENLETQEVYAYHESVLR